MVRQVRDGRVEALDLVLDGRDVGLELVGAVLLGLQLDAQPALLTRGLGQGAAQPPDLALPADLAFAGLDPTTGLRSGRLLVGAAGLLGMTGVLAGTFQQAGGGGDVFGDLRKVTAVALCLTAKLLGVTAGDGFLGGFSESVATFDDALDDAAGPLDEVGEGELGLGGQADGRGQLRQALGDGLLVPLEGGVGLLQLAQPLVGCRAAGLLGGPAVQQSSQVTQAAIGADGVQLIGEVAVLGCSFGLAFQGAQLSAHLAEQVDQSFEVALHLPELAQRPLLAAAVLEDAGRFLDERAAFLGTGVEDGVDASLPDDGVGLATQSRVGQQLGDIQLAALDVVDRVGVLARGEHGPADRHLGELDRQAVVGVVDGDLHRRPPHGLAAARTGEDDVRHRATAQVLGGPGAHRPGECVHDVGLARPVGSDDHGDAGLEVQPSRVGEGLEATQGERLEIHGHTNSRPCSPTLGSPWTTKRTAPDVESPTIYAFEALRFLHA